MNGGALGCLVTGVSLKCLLGAFHRDIVVVVVVVAFTLVVVVVYFAIRLHH